MTQSPVVVDAVNPTRVVLHADSVDLTPEQFFRLCADNPDLELELTARKEIVIMSPAGGEGSAWNLDITTQLGNWVKRDGTGVGFDSSGGFTLPNGAVRSPDAAWLPRHRWEALTREERMKFPPVCPDFVLELRSPRDSLRDLQEKMAEYVACGARLGWLIDPFERKVYVYREDRAPEPIDAPRTVCGDPVLPGFTLDPTGIWGGETADGGRAGGKS